MSPAACPKRSLTSLNRSRSRHNNRELLPGGQGSFDFLIEFLVKAAPIGKASQSVVMCQEADVLFGFLATPQVTHCYCVMRLSGEVDKALNQFHRNSRAVDMPHLSFDRLIGVHEEP